MKKIKIKSYKKRTDRYIQFKELVGFYVEFENRLKANEGLLKNVSQ